MLSTQFQTAYTERRSATEVPLFWPFSNAPILGSPQRLWARPISIVLFFWVGPNDSGPGLHIWAVALFFGVRPYDFCFWARLIPYTSGLGLLLLGSARYSW